MMANKGPMDTEEIIICTKIFSIGMFEIAFLPLIRKIAITEL